MNAETQAPIDSTLCLTRTVAEAMKVEPALEAVKINRARRSISVATLGRPKRPDLEEFLTAQIRQIERAEAGQRCALLDGAADPRSLNQAVGRVGFAGRAIAGLGTPDEHLSMLHESAASGSSLTKYYGTTFHFSTNIQHPCGLAADEIGKWAKS